MEHDWQALLAGQISMLVACVGGAKNPKIEDFVITRAKPRDPFEGFS